MENKKKKCSSKKHIDIDAICFCQECKVYMCNKCHKFHSHLLYNHHLIDLDKLDKSINQFFTGICDEKNHLNKLIFYCIDHNKLCCASCIIKVKRDGYGQHANCNVCNIENIEEEKRMKLESNINSLENLSNTLEQSLNELKKFLLI